MTPSAATEANGTVAPSGEGAAGGLEVDPATGAAAGNGVTTRLALGPFPSAALVGGPLPTFSVQLEDEQGGRVQQSGERVSLVIDDGPDGAEWVGFATAETRDGVATFDAVGLDRAGTYRVSAQLNQLQSEIATIEIEAPAFVNVATNMARQPTYAVLAASHEVVYASTDQGVYRSDNVGVSWTHFSFGVRAATGPLRASPADTDVVYAEPVIVERARPRPLARTLNRGVTWRPVLEEPAVGEPALDVALDELRARVAWACGASGVARTEDTGDHWVRTSFEGECGAIAFGGPAPGALYASRNRTLLKSTDGGESWQTALDSANGLLELHAASSGALFAVSLETIQRSDDGGVTWYVYPANVSRLVSSPSAPERLYAATRDRVRVSTDGGATFDEGVDLAPWTLFQLSVDPTDALRVYAATSGGLVVSTDGGVSWAPPSTGLDQANGVVFHPTVPGRILATGGPLYQSDDLGDSWSRIDAVPVADSIAFHPDDPSLAYACGASAIYETRDGGETWTSVTTDVACRELAVDGSTIWVAGPNGVVRSEDGGVTWTAPLLELSTYRLVASPGGGPLYATTNTGAYKSSDAGDSWTLMFTTNTSSPGLALDPTRSSRLLASACDRTSDEALLRLSSNSGDTWSAPANMPAVVPPCLQAFSFGRSGAMFVLLDRLYVSRDVGATWAASALTGVLRLSDPDLVISPDESTIFAASDSGLFRARNTGL